MKITTCIKSFAVLGIIVLVAGFALPASADTTTAGYYDQFGNFQVYQSYTPSTNPYFLGGNVYYNGSGYYNPYNPGGYNTYTRTSPYGSQVVCSTGELYDQFNNMCVPSTRRGATAVASSNLDLSGSKTATTKAVASNDNYQSSAISTLFGGKKTSNVLSISGVAVTSGPKNIYEDKSDVNCDVTVAWTTSIAAAGQVVYGTTSQPDADTFSYPLTATEGNSLQKTHEVKLGCLENATYSFRVIAYSSGANSQRVVSDEYQIFPIKIRTQIPTVTGGSTTTGGTDSGASVFATIGSILVSPVMLIVLLGIVAYLVIRRVFRKGAGHASGSGHEVAAIEPVLQIPHN